MEETSKKFISITLETFLQDYSKYKDKCITLTDCPILVCSKAVTSNYFIKMNKNSGAKIFYYTDSSQEQKFIALKESNLFSANIRGISKEYPSRYDNMLIPGPSILSAILTELSEELKDKKDNYRSLFLSAEKRYKELQNVTKTYPELFI